jgi:hypothetical protein
LSSSVVAEHKQRVFRRLLQRLEQGIEALPLKRCTSSMMEYLVAGRSPGAKRISLCADRAHHRRRYAVAASISIRSRKRPSLTARQ